MDIELTLSHFAENAPHFMVEVIQICAAAALERLARPHAYDLLLLDLRMPDQRGLDFIREAKRLKLSLPPFLIISGQVSDTMSIAAMRLGAADYLCKTTGYLDQLPHRIDHALTEDRLSRLYLDLRTELGLHMQSEENLRLHQVELQMQNENLHQTHPIGRREAALC